MCEVPTLEPASSGAVRVAVEEAAVRPPAPCRTLPRRPRLRPGPVGLDHEIPDAPMGALGKKGSAVPSYACAA